MQHVGGGGWRHESKTLHGFSSSCFGDGRIMRKQPQKSRRKSTRAVHHKYLYLLSTLPYDPLREQASTRRHLVGRRTGDLTVLGGSQKPAAAPGSARTNYSDGC